MAPVTLRVYDLSRGMARQLSPALLGKQIDGVWHTGVLVHGSEFFFGGGIQVMAPELVVARYGMQPVQSIPLGDTDVSLERLERFLREVSPRFTVATYDLLRHNCNNFSDEVARFLLGRGIPQYILDLPNEVLNTPFGTMLRPMLESMQSQMNGAADVMPFANPFNDATRASAPVSTLSTTTPQAASSTPVANLMSRRFKVSANPALYLDKIVGRVAALNADRQSLLSEEDLAGLKELAAHDQSADASTEPIDASKRLAWWSVLLKLLNAPDQHRQSQWLFPALAIFRVLLLEQASSAEIAAVKNQCFDQLVRVMEAEEKSPSLTDAQKILVLSVLVNAFANRTASELVLARAVQFLPFVFKAIAESSNHDVKVLSATLISNCCLALKMEEEVVITTLICGAVETLDRISQQVRAPVSPSQVQTIESVVAGVGQLLRNFEGARALSVELGLAEVLRRLNVAPGLGNMQPLLSELVSLM